MVDSYAPTALKRLPKACIGFDPPLGKTMECYPSICSRGSRDDGSHRRCPNSRQRSVPALPETPTPTPSPYHHSTRKAVPPFRYPP
ncbi:hypothetical protein MUK42_10624 [Musa troglodytarum]|uniref:Uncharacterized protein n=1 Tax=Musa troglodytarum TaxID=320322 RepID=A0A9E7JYQ7_9LILI|nr:hypothetical protein MUK42_10624 [Musa troglodytarum]